MTDKCHNIIILSHNRHGVLSTIDRLLEACVEEVQGRGVLPASGWECAEPLEGVSGDGLDLLDEEAEPGEYGARTLELAVSRDAAPFRAAMEAAEGGGTLPEPEVYYYHSDHLETCGKSHFPCILYRMSISRSCTRND